MGEETHDRIQNTVRRRPNSQQVLRLDETRSRAGATFGWDRPMSQLSDPTGGTLGPRMYAWVAAIGIGLAAGAYGIVSVLTQGAVVLGIDSQIPWGILISTYVLFALFSTGICIGVTSLSSVFGVDRFDPVAKRGILLSLFTLAAGGLVIMAGLGQPLRAIPQMLLAANPSAPMWWMIVLYSVYSAALVAEFYLLDRADQPSGWVTRGVGIVALVAPILAGAMLGAIFGTAEARPYYGEMFASVYLLVTAVFSGVALLTAVAVIERRFTAATPTGISEELITGTLGRYLGVLAAITLFLTGLRHAYGLTATNEALALASEQMLLGTHSVWTVGVGIVLGMVVPTVLLASSKTRSVGSVLIASVLVIVGMFASRLEFVLGGQVVALTNDPSHQVPIVSYVPSVAEIAIVTAGVALFALLYTAGWVLFDLDELPSHRERSMDHAGGDTSEVTGDD